MPDALCSRRVRLAAPSRRNDGHTRHIADLQPTAPCQHLSCGAAALECESKLSLSPGSKAPVADTTAQRLHRDNGSKLPTQSGGKSAALQGACGA